MEIRTAETFSLRIPFTDGSAGIGLMPAAWTHLDIVLLRLESTDGLVGWGEGFAYGCRTATLSALRDMVLPHVVGRRVDEPGSFTTALQRTLHLQGRFGITSFALSALDIALWDLAAKARQCTLAELLGGRLRDRLPAYASLVRYGEPAPVRDFVGRAIAEGYRTVKLHEIALDAIEAGRIAAQAPVALVTDVNCNWSRAQAEQMMPEMKRMDLYWVEEPVYPPDDALALGALQTRFGVSIASGENAATREGFAATAGHIDFLQPSVTKVGGVTEFLAVCDLAKANGRTVMPHSPYFGPGYWATAQLMAARDECGLFEMLYIDPDAWLDPSIPLPRDGELVVPAAPGIGFEPDPGVLRRYAVPA